MRRLSRTISRTGVFLTALSLGACDPAGQSGETNTATTQENAGGTGKTESSGTPEQKYMKRLDECAAAASGTPPLNTIADAVALINKLPKPVEVRCFMAALPRPIEVAATISSLSAQPSKNRNHPRFIVASKNLLITVTADGSAKDHVEFGELHGNTESVKGDLTFPITANIGPEAPYVDFFNTSTGETSCAFCHVNERPMGNGYPAEATISRALAPPADKLMLRFEVEEHGRQCEGKLTVACILARSIFYGGMPAEYKIPADMPSFSTRPGPTPP